MKPLPPASPFPRRHLRLVGTILPTFAEAAQRVLDREARRLAWLVARAELVAEPGALRLPAHPRADLARQGRDRPRRPPAQLEWAIAG